GMSSSFIERKRHQTRDGSLLVSQAGVFVTEDLGPPIDMREDVVLGRVSLLACTNGAQQILR
ncbi:hypothetical protein ACFP5Z_02665, partial [Kocuria oceani]